MRKLPSFWRTVRLLLGAARKRAAGRRRRQQELLQNRSKKGKATNFGPIGSFFTALLMLGLNVGAAYTLKVAVDSGARVGQEQEGKIVVSRSFLRAVQNAEAEADRALADCRTSVPNPETNCDQARHEYLTGLQFASEASTLSDRFGGSEKDIEHRLKASVFANGSRDLVTLGDVSHGLSSVTASHSLAALLGSLSLLWWVVMLVFQGEGLELDTQRRRNPVWEFLFSHPVPPGAIFLAEMLSPIAANYIYWGGPLFVGFLYGFLYDFPRGALAAFVIGVPLTIAIACLGKALEIAVTLRFPPRTRGAIIGLMSWLGYVSMMLVIFGAVAMPMIVTAAAPYLRWLTFLPWPWVRIFLGGLAGGSFDFVAGMAACWLATITIVAGSVWFSVWGAQQGLAGNFTNDTAVSAKPARFGREPLYRKELLWFVRDRSAIVQTILIPITIAGVQVFNLRGILSHAQGAWNYICGAGILFGTYFLWILGPKSLTSEGTALWIALTWPRGLESLLKAKAWLWSMISTGIVALVLCYAIYVFPAQTWKIALVGVGWFIFGRSMAEKAVTLVSVTSDSGEQQKVPSGQRWAAQLGMLTFSIGVLTEQWNLAIVGIVYSFLTAAAMWQNFRARLPYLYDPWSEEVPAPPTLMHAMIGISILVEATAVITGLVSVGLGRESLAAAQATSYAFCSVVVSVGVALFLSNRNVLPKDVWLWPTPTRPVLQWWKERDAGSLRFFGLLLVGAGAGVALGLAAHGYTALLNRIPEISERLWKAKEQFENVPNLKISFAIIAIGFAPFAEEYLFRGLLFRALDREWGGWRAVVGSAAFFAIYHPTLSWAPVFVLGATNAVLFKKTGRLAPAVILHMVYNAVVLN